MEFALERSWAYLVQQWSTTEWKMLAANETMPEVMRQKRGNSAAERNTHQ
jgi:hypothetical protein